MTRYVLGHDVGTSGDKVVLCDLSGNVLASATEPYPLAQPRPGWAQQDGEQLLAAVVRASRRVLDEYGASGRDVVAMGVSGQMLCTVAVDDRACPLSPLLSWLDTRATDQAEHIFGGDPAAQWRELGSVATAKDIVARILWLRDAEPDAWARSAALLDCKDFITGRLTGQIATDHAGASAYLLYDVVDRHWKAAAAESLGIPLDKLPRVTDATAVLGGLTAQAATSAGLRPRTPVAVGTGDVPAGQLGAGAALPGQVHLSLGTASYYGVSLDRPLTDPGRRLAVWCHADAARWLLWAEMETGAGALSWWRRLAGLDDPDQVDRLADLVDPTDDVPLFAPWLTGERVPYWDDRARAAFVGLTFAHDAGHLVRAVMEGICFQLRQVLDYAEAFGVEVGELRVAGGAGIGRALPAMLAHVLGRPLAVVEEPQAAGARGAAFCALAAIGQSSLDELAARVKVVRRIEPKGRTDEVERRFERFRLLHDALAGIEQ